MAVALTLAEVETISNRMLIASGASSLQANATARSIADAEAEGIRTVGDGLMVTLTEYAEHGSPARLTGDR